MYMYIIFNCINVYVTMSKWMYMYHEAFNYKHTMVCQNIITFFSPASSSSLSFCMDWSSWLDFSSFFAYEKEILVALYVNMYFRNGFQMKQLKTYEFKSIVSNARSRHVIQWKRILQWGDQWFIISQRRPNMCIISIKNKNEATSDLSLTIQVSFE